MVEGGADVDEGVVFQNPKVSGTVLWIEVVVRDEALEEGLREGLLPVGNGNGVLIAEGCVDELLYGCCLRSDRCRLPGLCSSKLIYSRCNIAKG